LSLSKNGHVVALPAQGRHGKGLLGKDESRMPPTILANDFHEILALFLVSRCTEGIGT
jgi:hypothetical protein